MANGSNAPVGDFDPLASMRAGVFGITEGESQCNNHESLTPLEALRTITTGPAWLEHSDHIRGQLIPGALADLVVLSANPLDKRHLAEEIEIVGTMLGGRWVHGHPPWE